MRVESSVFSQERKQECSKKKMKRARDFWKWWNSDRSAHFWKPNVNKEAQAALSPAVDQDTCVQIKTGTEKSHFGARVTPRHTEPRRSREARTLSLFAEHVNSSRLGGLGTDQSSDVLDC